MTTTPAVAEGRAESPALSPPRRWKEAWQGRWRASRERRLPYLDGIRAFAVLAVLLYHGGVHWVTGGLLGVDVFFVLSGYLITNLLCREYERRGGVRLGSFWAARARRLLPALLVLLLGVAAYTHFVVGPGASPGVRGDSFSTLFYFANWHFVLSDQGYFVQTGAPSPLLHTWSLSVEEQYYLIWPLVALFVLRRWGRRALAGTAAGGALASAALMASLALVGVSADRLYYGTDTRAQALLVGSALGALAAGRGWSVVKEPWAARRAGRLIGAAVGVAAVLWLIWAWHALEGTNGFLYRGGFLLTALAAGGVIVNVTGWSRGPLARFLSLGPFVFLGRISYGVYLYHWPLFLWINHARTGLEGTPLLLVRLAVTLAVSTLSFWLIEEPVRNKRWRWRHRAVPAALGTSAAAVTLAVVTVSTAVPIAGGSALANPAQTAQQAIPPAEAAALRSTGAFGTNPVRFELLGDSEALTLNIGLEQQSIKNYGVQVYGGSWLGCDIDANLPTLSRDVPQPPSRICGDWRRPWSELVLQSRAQVVGILLGRFELLDHRYKGRWMHVGEAAWDRHLATQLEDAVHLVSAGGAEVVLFTVPYVDPPEEAPDGSPYPEDMPSRVDAYNQVLQQVARSNPGVVTVIPLNRIVDPAGTYQATIDGVKVRTSDGIHFTRAGGEWLQPRLLPTVASLGLSSSQR